MNIKFDETKPIFLQIKEMIEDLIIKNTLQAGERVPSTNELAAHYKINPATAAKGVNELVDEGILYKRRGVGMFVVDQAREMLLEKHRAEFYEEFIKPLKQAAEKLNINEDELINMLKREED